MTFEIEEGHRQLILRGLAIQALVSPGFDYACCEAAKCLHGEEMFVQFKNYLSDLFKPVPASLGGC